MSEETRLPKEIETVNDYEIKVKGDHVLFTFPPSMLTKEEAVRTAAWLVRSAGWGARGRFEQVYEAVKSA